MERTAEIFHVNNNVRLMRIAFDLPRKIYYKNKTFTLPKIKTDVNDNHFKKTISETTKIY
jgi:hypothetical protein